MSDRPTDLDALDLLEQMATAGPWEATGVRQSAALVTADDGREVVAHVLVHPLVEPRAAERTADFIAAMRTAAPALIAELRRLRDIEGAARVVLAAADEDCIDGAYGIQETRGRLRELRVTLTPADPSCATCGGRGWNLVRYGRDDGWAKTKREATPTWHACDCTRKAVR